MITEEEEDREEVERAGVEAETAPLLPRREEGVAVGVVLRTVSIEVRRMRWIM